jgi:hypothetical protein
LFNLSGFLFVLAFSLFYQTYGLDVDAPPIFITSGVYTKTVQPTPVIYSDFTHIVFAVDFQFTEEDHYFSDLHLTGCRNNTALFNAACTMASPILDRLLDIVRMR